MEPKILDFFMHYSKSFGINKKNMFLFFFNYLETETRKHSEKNYTNVLLDGQCSDIFRRNFYFKFNNKKNVFFKQIDFLKKTSFLKTLKKFIAIAPSITQISGI